MAVLRPIVYVYRSEEGRGVDFMDETGAIDFLYIDAVSRIFGSGGVGQKLAVRRPGKESVAIFVIKGQLVYCSTLDIINPDVFRVIIIYNKGHELTVWRIPGTFEFLFHFEEVAGLTRQVDSHN